MFKGLTLARLPMPRYAKCQGRDGCLLIAAKDSLFWCKIWHIVFANICWKDFYLVCIYILPNLTCFVPIALIIFSLYLSIMDMIEKHKNGLEIMLGLLFVIQIMETFKFYKKYC